MKIADIPTAARLVDGLRRIDRMMETFKAYRPTDVTSAECVLTSAVADLLPASSKSRIDAEVLNGLENMRNETIAALKQLGIEANDPDLSPPKTE